LWDWDWDWDWDWEWIRDPLSKSITLRDLVLPLACALCSLLSLGS
jgi:hypothetical protein